MNRLFFGDNLKWLRDRTIFPDACVDLARLDPPFNSNANFNFLSTEACVVKLVKALDMILKTSPMTTCDTAESE